ncbi:acyloxyacyl hydrolase [Pedobacter gandavensis]|uniref:outer membrane protein n=1 Tax=Pedobacter TaxID=84567 RepID=UPI001C996543|nr:MULTISPECIES: outer membrane beta-barrel protein [Pedobacter]WGQ11939.1 acyloxyacyl hydrolase [Pedobacter gandavensis]
MKKLFLLTAIAGIFAFSNAQAQKDPAMNGPKLGIGAEFAFPVGNFGDFQNFGYGGSLNYQHPIAPNLNLTGSAGYINFESKEILGTKFNSGFIPVKAGARYFLAENFYINGELGASFATGSNNSGTAFVYSPGIGVEFPVSDKSSVDLGGRYEGWSNNGTASFFGIRAAFNFGL